MSDFALREGVLLDTWQRRHGGSLHHLSDLRRRSVLALAGADGRGPGRTPRQVARLALELFDATRDRHGLGDDARELLEAAALLCNVGLFLSHAAAPQAQLLRDPRAPTASPASTTTRSSCIALVARYHRKSEPKPKHAEFAALDDDDQRVVRALAGLLRIAIGLDRNHAGRVASVSRGRRRRRASS